MTSSLRLSRRLSNLALVFGAITLTASVAIAQEAAERWITFTPKEGKLSVELPKEPEESHQDMDTEAGPATIYSWTVAGEGQAYFVSFNEMPPAVVNADPKAVLDGARDGAVSNIHGELESQSVVSLKGFPGIDFVTKVSDTMRVRQRVFLVGKRMYQLLVITETGEFQKPEMERFFSSFKLLEAEAPKKSPKPPTKPKK